MTRDEARVGARVTAQAAPGGSQPQESTTAIHEGDSMTKNECPCGGTCPWCTYKPPKRLPSAGAAQ